MKITCSYGGAFDIDPDIFFSKEELDEFGELVCEKLSKELGVPIVFDRCTVDPSNGKQMVYVEISYDGASFEQGFIVDMRKIRRPNDLNKYVDKLADKFRPDVVSILEAENSYLESSTSVTAASTSSYKNSWQYKEVNQLGYKTKITKNRVTVYFDDGDVYADFKIGEFEEDVHMYPIYLDGELINDEVDFDSTYDEAVVACLNYFLTRF